MPSRATVAASTLALLLVALAPTGAALPHDDDAGSGRDAGGSLSTALTVTPGTYTGALYWEPARDTSDTYRVALEPHQALRVEITPHDGYLYFVDPHGSWTRISAYAYPGESSVHLTSTVVAGHAYFMLAGRANYTFTVSLFDAPDLVAQSLEWSEVPLTTPAGDLPFSVLREVRAAVVNAGPGSAQQVEIVLEVQHDASVRRIARVMVPALEPGEQAEVVARWDQTGEVGDGILRLRTSTPIERGLSNNVLEQHAYVGLGGTGRGHDALNKRVVVGTLPVLVSVGDVHVGVYHQEREAGVFTGLWTHNFFSGYSSYGWVRVNVSSAGTPSAAFCLRSTFDPCPDPQP